MEKSKQIMTVGNGPEKSSWWKKVFNRDNLGWLLGLAACLVFWFPYPYTEKILWIKIDKHLCLLPNLISGLVGLFVMFILYARNIISYEKKSISIVSFLVNLTLFATIVQIFINPANLDRIHRSDVWFVVTIAVIAAIIAIIIFGVQEFAKIAVLIGVIFLCISNLSIVNDAMGFMGFVNILLIVASFYFQQNINLEGLKNDFNYLWDKKVSSNNLKDERNQRIEKKQRDEILKTGRKKLPDNKT